MTAAAARARKQTQPKELETITGVVKRRIFFNQENGFCVLAIDAGKANSLGEPEDIKATGCMASVREGDTYTLKGNFINNPKFGEQFKFVESELVMPTGTVGVARYLSNVTYGVGQAKARRIVEDLGDDCLEKIRENPSILDRLDYLNPGQKAEIIEDLKTNSIQAELAGLICREGIGPAMVSKIYNKYGNDSVKMVKENPYIIADELWGVGFKKADVVAQTVGIAANSPYRVEAAVNFALNDAGSEGHVYLKPSTIVKKLIGKGGLIEASGVGIPEIKEANGKLIAEGRCIREGDAVYCKDLYEYECIVAGKIRSLLSRQIEVKADLESMINEVEERDGIQYAPEQREAVKMSLVNPVSIITGGPGTGKSTVMNAVVSIYRKLHPDGYIHLAAPTGRAAKRISETTGRTAKTIHRLLQYNPQYGGFQFNADNPLYGPGLLIVDESSMIDIELMAHLITAVYDLQVILVGDVDQLPSVGPGSVLRDCIASGKVPTVRLKYNYRQAGGSKIAEYANVICQGITPPLRSEGDFEFIPIDDADHAVEVILDMVRTAIDLGYGQMDFQVLAPMRRGSCGVAALNDKVRELVNPASPEKPEFGGFRCEDKVMVIKNDYNLGVFNGDLGEIINIEKGTLTIDFGDGIANFRQEDLGILTLAYASTIHKSQGSEFPVVIMPMTRQHYIMLQRNLLYTGMTRAKKRLILVADEWSVKKAVGNNVIEERFSMLAERIRKE